MVDYNLNVCDFSVFSARCNIYISHLCYDVSVRLSVHLSVTFVHCDHKVQWIRISMHAWIDGCLCYLLTTPHPDGIMPGFLVEEGGMEKLVIVAISLVLLTESLDRKHVTVLFISTTTTMLTFL